MSLPYANTLASLKHKAQTNIKKALPCRSALKPTFGDIWGIMG